MIFTPALARAILGGRKTQTRIPTVAGKRCPLKIGHDYAVRTGPGKPVSCHVTVLARARQQLDAITHRDARAEGFRTTNDFRAEWVRRHDAAWVDRELVDLAAAFDDTASVPEWILLERFRQRHAERQVWAILFAVQQHGYRYLASQTDILAGGDQYTANKARAIDELEIPPAQWLEAEAKRARELGDAQRGQRRQEADAEIQERRNLRVLVRSGGRRGR